MGRLVKTFFYILICISFLFSASKKSHFSYYEVNEQITVFAPREPNKQSIQQVSPEEKTAKALVRIQEKMIQEYYS